MHTLAILATVVALLAWLADIDSVATIAVLVAAGAIAAQFPGRD